jgi:hypothetical protein
LCGASDRLIIGSTCAICRAYTDSMLGAAACRLAGRPGLPIRLSVWLAWSGALPAKQPNELAPFLLIEHPAA